MVKRSSNSSSFTKGRAGQLAKEAEIDDGTIMAFVEADVQDYAAVPTITRRLVIALKVVDNGLPTVANRWTGRPDVRRAVNGERGEVRAVPHPDPPSSHDASWAHLHRGGRRSVGLPAGPVRADNERVFRGSAQHKANSARVRIS